MRTNRKMCKLISGKLFMVWLLLAAVLFADLPLAVSAKEVTSEESRIIVSLGDSYSSGEGIEPFYGQEKVLSKRVKDVDWLAHRSRNAWPGMLTLPAVEGTMSENRDTPDPNWYFNAVSGATTADICKSSDTGVPGEKLVKKYSKGEWITLFPTTYTKYIHYSDSVPVSNQLDIFDAMGEKKADYVTLTIGGNDADFAGVIEDVVLGSTYLNFGGLSDKLNQTWDDFYKDGGIRDNIRLAYKRIADSAGPQSQIIVAGYPQLLDVDGQGIFPSKAEAEMVNAAVSSFNLEIERIVRSCRSSGMKICFVDVQDAFKGHEAYSDDPYIREVMLGTQPQDIKDIDVKSAYSVHPNDKGAEAYAECVQAKIDELEGIDVDVYSRDLTISTYGYTKKLYDDYKIIVEGKERILWGFFKREYYDEITVNESKEIPLSLPKGTFTITVTDGERSYFKNIRTRDNSDNKELIFKTRFGYLNLIDEYFPGEDEEYEVPIRTTSDERDIVLVLDTSGSMAGAPIEETKEASTNFVETILKEDASIGIVTYNSSAACISDFSVDEQTLKQAVSTIYGDGSTNIDAGLAVAETMLQNSNAKKKIIVLMSDGVPNLGREGDNLIAYADEIKDERILIYTLGFFDSIGSGKSSAQYLMEQIASDGCHYEVAEAEELVFFFEDMADQINGTRYIYVRIACPVDVSVSYNGETLNSAEDDLCLRTDFGTLTFEENENASADADDRIKVLRLKEGVDYDIQIVGTGRGLMDYTIGFMDEEGEYTDMRKFEDIKITKTTVIDTVASVSEETILKVDEDGDGRYDVKYRAQENRYGEEIRSDIMLYVCIGVGTFAVVILVLVIRKGRKKNEKKAGKKNG